MHSRASKLIYILFVFLQLPALAQEKVLHGKVISGNSILPGVFVINKTTGQETKTDNSGFFSLEAAPNQRLVIYGKDVKTREFLLSQLSFKDNPYLLEVEVGAQELDEVVVNKITTESLGLATPGMQKYNPTAHRLAKMSNGTGLMYLINIITGKRRDLKRARDAIKKQELADNLLGMLTDSDYENCGLKPEMGQGFVYYAVENPRFAEVVYSGTPEFKLLLIELAQQYLELQKEP